MIIFIKKKRLLLNLLALFLGICSIQFSTPIQASGHWRTGYGYNPRFANYYQNSSETPDRVLWIHRQMVRFKLDSLCDTIAPISNPMDYVRKLHTQEHINAINSIGIDTANKATEKIGDIAELAVSYALGAVRDVCSGKIRNAFVNLRPPGHHVEANSQSTVGFCVYGNIPIAARYATEQFGIKRIMIIDWDYHHGNGTVSFVGNDLNVLFMEIGSSDIPYDQFNTVWKHIIVKEVGGDQGNVEFLKIWDDVFVPNALKFKPELILVSSGFDLKKNDGLGSFKVTAQGISMMTKKLMDIADSTCGGKIVSLLEGGYRDFGYGTTYQGLSECAENHLRTLMTSTIQPETPYFNGSAIKNNKIQGVKPTPRIDLRNLNKMREEYSSIKIMTIQGKVIYNSKDNCSLSKISTGVYCIELVDKKGVLITLPFVNK